LDEEEGFKREGVWWKMSRVWGDFGKVGKESREV
jgi:hypothetical protein